MEKTFKPPPGKQRILQVSDVRRQEIADLVAFWKHVGPCKGETLTERDEDLKRLDLDEQIVLITEMKKQGEKEDWLAQMQLRRMSILP